MESITLDQLIAARLTAKRQEEAAIQARREIDEQIATLLRPTDKLEGSVSQKIEGYKITVQYGINRSVDTEKLSADWSKIPASAQAAFRWKADVAVSELKKLDGVDATVAAVYITSKPAAPQIKIEAA